MIGDSNPAFRPMARADKELTSLILLRAGLKSGLFGVLARVLCQEDYFISINKPVPRVQI